MFEHSVNRREYLINGVLLAVVKYVVDVAIVYAASGTIWTPLHYFHPLTSLISARTEVVPQSVLAVLAAWALPFMWIGVSMSMRRALNAGLSAWLALLFFVPGVNYAFIAVMCVLPSRPRVVAEVPRPWERQLPGALLAMATGAIAGLAMIAIAVFGAQSYGASLFFGTPFLVGAITAFLFNRRYPASGRETQQVVLMTQLLIGGVALLTALDGAVCLLMALPLALGVGAMGAALGRIIALRDTGRLGPLYAIAALPAWMLIDGQRPPTLLREVVSSVVIDAPPAVVWKNVVQFPPLAPPSELTFRAGIAYPQRAWIDGEGVGAVRYCVFSTGAFVEPITHWEPGRRLSFDVTSQPAPLEEWSPYASVAAPHLDGYFLSRRGEFRLVELADGRIRLEGSTWYEMRMFPEAYWSLFGDAIISRIHARVLSHIRDQAESQSWPPLQRKVASPAAGSA
jgi:hypothetical protein